MLAERGWLQGASRDNVQGEYYLTDVVALAVEDSPGGGARGAGDRRF